jgi:hypothetical protein
VATAEASSKARPSRSRLVLSERPDLDERFGIDTLPTLIVIEGSRVRGRLADPGDCAAIERFLAPWLH